MHEKLISAKSYWTAQEAEAYDKSSSTRKIQHEMTKSILEHTGAKGRTLDIGCGTGFSMEVLDDPVGIDVSYEMLRLAKAKGFGRLLLADFRALPFRDGAFDALVSVSAMQWITGKDPAEVKEQYREAFGEMRRVLANGGKAGVQFYPATEKEWELAKTEAARLFKGKVVEEGEGKKQKRYLILNK